MRSNTSFFSSTKPPIFSPCREIGGPGNRTTQKANRKMRRFTHSQSKLCLFLRRWRRSSGQTDQFVIRRRSVPEAIIRSEDAERNTKCCGSHYIFL
ncbi:hypothetical protein PAAG_07220 [Paracoccidioides lutzii Pb01]|uniref:Uncharacterized protein n=1 Tax=Paracoccidioides lutzii (strain ATCC MYA-826 / Pb01) TaxID=502779 RepID=C1H8X9_PARBA|nr:hypothetical protein PAAG_07220 [Paracoccidioides lutzii Pb01]EEH36802.2 hypothetical protein PAAG_07220 [Paracoccidioides lutzii Pb01]